MRAGHSFQRRLMVRHPAVNRSLRRFDSFRWSSRPLGRGPTRKLMLVRIQHDAARHRSSNGRTVDTSSKRKWLLHSGDNFQERAARQGERGAPRTRKPACDRAHASRWSRTRFVRGVIPVRLRAWALVSSSRIDPTRKRQSVRIRPAAPWYARFPQGSSVHFTRG